MDPGVLTSDMRIRIEAANVRAYPDVSVLCGEPVFHDARRGVLTLDGGGRASERGGMGSSSVATNGTHACRTYTIASDTGASSPSWQPGS